VLANGRLPLCLKKARRNRRQPKPREASPSCQHSEQAESPTSSSAPTPRPLPPASDPGRLSVKATVDELIRSHHEWLGHPGIETTWRSLRAGLRDIPSLKGGISRNAVRRALLPCIRGGTCGRVKPRHAGDGSRGSLEVTQPGLRVTCDLVMGLSGGYSLHIQDQENDYLGVVVVEEKSSDAIDAAYERWTNSLEGDLTPQVMTDHGTEFQGKFGARLAEREAYNPLTPVGSHHSLGKNERSHREWLTILRGILHDRGLDDSHWRDFASLAATKYNRQPRGRSRKSPFERRWSAQPPSPPIAALRDLLQTTRRPSEGSSPFPVGSSVLYHHPDLPRAKLDPLWTPALVLQRVSKHVFRLCLPFGRPILAHRCCI